MSARKEPELDITLKKSLVRAHGASLEDISLDELKADEETMEVLREFMKNGKPTQIVYDSSEKA